MAAMNSAWRFGDRYIIKKLTSKSRLAFTFRHVRPLSPYYGAMSSGVYRWSGRYANTREFGRIGATRNLSTMSNFERLPFKKKSFMERPIHVSLERSLKSPFALRSQLKNAKRVVIKLGSAVITREDECGLALGRLASIVEQVAELQNEGRECLMVTSGAVAFGKQKLAHEQTLSMSMRETLHQRDRHNNSTKPFFVIEPRAAAAVGQSGLMSLYDAMFSQYGVKIAQVLVTKPDFYNEETRRHLASTVSELISLNIVPIINTNDAVSPPPLADEDLAGVISIKDNDSLAARLAAEVQADLLILMSDVDGIYTCPPSEEGARLINTYSPNYAVNIQYGKKSRVGLGGMDSKVRSACWALEKGISVVICNGMAENAVRNIIAGRKLGTFFTDCKNGGVSIESAAEHARDGGRQLQNLTGSQRSDIIQNLAELLLERQPQILKANLEDLKILNEMSTVKSGGVVPLLGRLTLTPAKLKSLSDGLKQIADSSADIVGRVMRRTLLAKGLELTQVTVPIGVLLVIFESRPDVLPQVAALAIASANGLLLKGGKEATHSNQILMDVVHQALDTAGVPQAVSLVSTREEISDLLTMDQYIDLVIPRGSGELVRSIQQQSRNIPVLGHSEGICHVYVDNEADPVKAMKIVRDAKCDYPSACNAMETLLIHEDLLGNTGGSGSSTGTFFADVCAMLKNEGVKIYAGPSLSKHLTFGPPPAKSLRTEYGSLECTIEVVKSLDEAVDHIHRYGSSHTDSIVTENREKAEQFLHKVDSACVFHNASTRFADGYRFGLGAEVGISTARIHARGPVGVEGLLTSKWVLRGSGDAASDFGLNSGKSFLHQSLSIDAKNPVSTE
ncbi:hypothetical protein OUZ56_014999 [Daphnia magna]|uniref:Delta-1-pyrroline-5-carboxylate synthase n=1 Tax=Daphnia magna TaxID=35525 RepID=A0ABR0ALG8_9CRUS|nr:hypothetical protein OUZ56_014999 [Daphnia magna]